MTPPASIAAKLNLHPRTDVFIVRRHVRYIDGKPAIISDDYFDEKIVRGTRTPTPAEIEKLGIPAGTPVAEHIRTGYTADNKPVRVMVSIIPGDTLILQYTIPA